MNTLSGKVALVTGAGSGIGAAITEELAKAGATVFAMDVSKERIFDMKEHVGDVKGDIIPLHCDVTNEDKVIAAFQFVRQTAGKLNILVNAAGIFRVGFLINGKISQFKEVFDVNVFGLLICAQQAIKLMQETGVGDGNIININSISGHHVPRLPEVHINVYHASKHAVTAITETFRQELADLGSKIRVTSLSPGSTETSIYIHALTKSGVNIDPTKLMEMGKNRTLLKPKDLADAVLYVVSTPPHVQVQELTVREMFNKSNIDSATKIDTTSDQAANHGRFTVISNSTFHCNSKL